MHSESVLGTDSVSQTLATWQRSAEQVASSTPSGFPWAPSVGRGRHRACNSSTRGSSPRCSQCWRCSSHALCRRRQVSAATHPQLAQMTAADTTHWTVTRTSSGVSCNTPATSSNDCCRHYTLDHHANKFNLQVSLSIQNNSTTSVKYWNLKPKHNSAYYVCCSVDCSRHYSQRSYSQASANTARPRIWTVYHAICLFTYQL